MYYLWISSCPCLRYRQHPHSTLYGDLRHLRCYSSRSSYCCLLLLVLICAGTGQKIHFRWLREHESPMASLVWGFAYSETSFINVPGFRPCIPVDGLAWFVCPFCGQKWIKAAATRERSVRLAGGVKWSTPHLLRVWWNGRTAEVINITKVLLFGIVVLCLVLYILWGLYVWA